MSYGTVWRINLDLYNEAEPLPITKLTDRRVYTEEWSGIALHPDGPRNIGKRKVIAFDRQELENNKAVYRGRIRYSLLNPDAMD